MISTAEKIEGTYLKPIKASELWRPKEPPRPIITGKSSQRIALVTAGLLAMASQSNGQERILGGRPGDRPSPFGPPALPGERVYPVRPEPLIRPEDHGPVVIPPPHLLPRMDPEPVVMTKETERIWSAMVLATNGEVTNPAPQELHGVSKTIQEVFGYKGMDVLGTAAKHMEVRNEQWLVPNQNFWFCIRSERGPNNSYLLRVQEFHDERPVVEMRARVTQNSPIIIRGPVCARGQIVFILQVLP